MQVVKGIYSHLLMLCVGCPQWQTVISVSTLGTASPIPLYYLFRCPLENHHPFHLAPDLELQTYLLGSRIWPPYPLNHQSTLIIPLRGPLSVCWHPLITGSCSNHMTPSTSLYPAYSGPGSSFAVGCQCVCWSQYMLLFHK